MHRGKIYIVLIACLAMMSCAPKALREAEEVVAQADSLRAAGQMYGIDAGDSATLAQAYETLGSLSLFNFHFSPSYAHACYHYGRLLREKDNPVEAMQCFINATHTRTRDYHILGRVYSNMGDIAHLAGEFPLAYDMYERSGQMYLQNGDSLLYYYDLNNMAFELAEQGKKEETRALLTEIENKTLNQHILVKIYETKARLYYKINQYDSVVQIVNHLSSIGYVLPTGYVMQACALWHLEKRDSALVIAKQIMDSQKASDKEKYNILYIIINGDTTLLPNEIKKLSELRADIEAELLVPLHKKNAVAVNILQKDISRKTNLNWLYSACITIIIISSILTLYIYHKRRQRTLLSQQVEDLNLVNKAIKQKHEQIVQTHAEYTSNLISQIEQNCTIISQSKDFPNNLCIKEFNAMRKIVDSNFNMLASKLCHLGILNETEIRLCILVFLNANRDQISDILPYAKNGVGKLKYRVSKKIGVDARNLRKSLITMVINESFK